MGEMAWDELDARDAARLTGRSTETIRRWAWAGRLPARKRGKKLPQPQPSSSLIVWLVDRRSRYENCCIRHAICNTLGDSAYGVPGSMALPQRSHVRVF
jgi:hypothetical protein